MSHNHILVKRLFSVLRQDFAGARLLSPFALDTQTQEELLSQLEGAASSQQEYLILLRYLGSLSIPSLRLLPTGQDPDVFEFTRGIRVRRHGEKLYVLPGGADLRFRKGDRLTALGRKTIEEARAENASLLSGALDCEENWELLLQLSGNCKVEKPGCKPTYQLLKRFPKPAPLLQENELFPLNKEAFVIRLSQLEDPSSLIAGLATHHKRILSSPYLILDLREVSGGYEDCCFPLLPYLFDETVRPAELVQAEEFYFNYTKCNSAALKQSYLGLMAECTEEALYLVTDLLAGLRPKQTAGMLLERDEIPKDWSTPLAPAGYTGQVLLLIDSLCEGNAERVVSLFRRSPRVTLLGRPTAGKTGYFYLASQQLDERYVLEYPSAVLKRLYEARPRTAEADLRIYPDLFIPWEPENETYESFLAFYQTR